MKLKILGTLAGLAMALPSTGAFAHTDVFVGLGFATPAPVVVERAPVYYDYDDDYYYPSTRVYYRETYVYPRRYAYAPRVYARSYWHDRGYHRGWRDHDEHEWRDHDHWDHGSRGYDGHGPHGR